MLHENDNNVNSHLASDTGDKAVPLQPLDMLTGNIYNFYKAEEIMSYDLLSKTF